MQETPVKVWIGVGIGILCLLLGFQDVDREYFKRIKKHRKERKKEFRNPQTSPLKGEARSFKGFAYFPIDPAYRVMAYVEHTPQARPFEVPTSDPTVHKTYVSYARATFSLKGQSLSLTLYRSLQLIRLPQYRDYVFLPFRDQSSGRTTYGGGRYLDLTLPEGDSLVIDFNLAYNPNCAYSEGWACPIPPAENTLPVAIEAGEKAYVP